MRSQRHSKGRDMWYCRRTSQREEQGLMTGKGNSKERDKGYWEVKCHSKESKMSLYITKGIPTEGLGLLGCERHSKERSGYL